VNGEVREHQELTTSPAAVMVGVEGVPRWPGHVRARLAVLLRDHRGVTLPPASSLDGTTRAPTRGRSYEFIDTRN
jgi:hypothetical protein